MAITASMVKELRDSTGCESGKEIRPHGSRRSGSGQS